MVSFGTMTGRKLVYLVDDEPLLLRAMERVLLRLQVEIRSFPDPTSALAACRERLPDLVVSDLALNSPMDGLNFLQALRRIATLRTLLISGAVEAPAVAEEAVRAGVLDSFLKKPWLSQELSQAVAGLLGIPAQDLAPRAAT